MAELGFIKMQCLFPVHISKGLNRKDYPEGLSVPCGKCLPCRIKKRNEWSLRLMHEFTENPKSMFLTLTYDDEHLKFYKYNEYDRVKGQIIYPTLHLPDLQKFHKRLRKRLDERKIKYFSVGEYGPDTQRPHYHSILFNVSLDKEDRLAVMDSWSFCDWKNYTIRKNSFGSVSSNSIQYVAKYIDKLYTADAAIREYQLKNREPSFRLISKGIGYDFARKNKEQMEDLKYLSMNGSKLSIPRYYVNKLELDKQALKENAQYSECEQVEEITGLNVSEDVFYKTQKPEDVIKYYEEKKRKKKQYALNCAAVIDRRANKL